MDPDRHSLLMTPRSKLATAVAVGELRNYFNSCFFLSSFIYDPIIGFFQSSFLAYGNLAAILAREQRQTEAEHAYRQALTHRPNMAETHFNL